jgi:tetratricopeptide (TPR) repeat protein
LNSPFFLKPRNRDASSQKHAVLSKLVSTQLAELEQPPGVQNHQDSEIARELPASSGRKWVAVSCLLTISIAAMAIFAFLHVHESNLTTTASENTQAVFHKAIEYDAAVSSVSPTERRSAIDQARKELGNAIAILGSEEDSTHIPQLRRLLIKRLLQLGGNWCREAERQIVLLNETPGNPTAVKWMALAMVGQFQKSTSDDRNPDKFKKHSDYWNWLSHQKPGQTLLRAIELNPTDVQLLANLVEISSGNLTAFQFSGSNRELNQAWLRERVARKLIKIEANEDSRSCLIRYRFQRNNGNLSQGLSDLARGFKKAANRLQDPVDLDELIVEDQQSMWLDSFLPSTFWDYMLVKELGTSTSDSTVATKCFRLLATIEANWIPSKIREETCVAAGEHFHAHDNQEEAIQIWRAGLTNINANSVALNSAVAEATISSDTETISSETKLTALNRLQNSIELAAVRLANSPFAESSNADRRAKHHEIQVARWKMNLLKSELEYSSNQSLKAIEILESTLASQLEVETSRRVNALVRLAELYDEQGASDNAAATFDRAISLSPENYELRVQSAEAWNRVGDRQRSTDQWMMVGQSDSIGLRIASLEALFEFELTRPKSEQRLDKIRTSVGQIRKQIGRSDEGSVDKAWLGRLALLEFSLPPTGVEVQSHLDSPELSTSISNLASEFKNDEAVQRFAAEYFAAHGDQEQSITAIKRIEFFSGKNSFAAVVAQSRIEATSGQIKIACQRLRDHANEHTEDSERALLIASSWARQFEEYELAYELLLDIPPSRHSAFILYSIASAAKELPSDGRVAQSQNLRPIELALKWKSRLENFEGDTGSWWKFLEATWLVDHIQSGQVEVGTDDPRLVQSRILLSQLNNTRPYWNKVMSLEGAIYAVELNPIQAIKHLKRGIAAGDDRIQTKQLLLHQMQLLDPSNAPNKRNFASNFSTFSPASVEIFLHAHACLKRNLKDLPARYVAEHSFAKKLVFKIRK